MFNNVFKNKVNAGALFAAVLVSGPALAVPSVATLDTNFAVTLATTGLTEFQSFAPMLTPLILTSGDGVASATAGGLRTCDLGGQSCTLSFTQALSVSAEAGAATIAAVFGVGPQLNLVFAPSGTLAINFDDFMLTPSTTLGDGFDAFAAADAQASPLVLVNGELVDLAGPGSTASFAFADGGTVSVQLGTLLLPGENAGGALIASRQNIVVGGVPEPASWAMLIVGFAGVGANLRRRRTSAATAS